MNEVLRRIFFLYCVHYKRKHKQHATLLVFDDLPTTQIPNTFEQRVEHANTPLVSDDLPQIPNALERMDQDTSSQHGRQRLSVDNIRHHDRHVQKCREN